MENKDMVNLLEKSILPLMAEMIKAMGEHSHRYENHVKEIKEKVGSVELSVKDESTMQQNLLDGINNISKSTEKLTNRENNNEEVLTILTKTITTFGERITALIDTNNNLIEYQKVQSDRMDDVIYAFEENTARLNTLTLAIRDNEMELLKGNSFNLDNPIYNELLNEQEEIINEQTTIQPLKKVPKPIHQVLEEEISKLKGNK